MTVHKNKTKRLLKVAFHEVNKNTPAAVKKTRKKHGKKRASKQKIAIALSKARRKGAKIPKKRRK